MMGCEEPEEFDIYSDLITDFDAKSSHPNSQTPPVVIGTFDQKSDSSDSEYGLTIASQTSLISSSQSQENEDQLIIDSIESNKEAKERCLNNAAEIDNELYVDFVRDKQEQHLKNAQNELTEENVALKKQISELKNKNQELCNQLTILKNNLSALLKTADAEIKRKNLQIHEIRQRLDGVLFRREQGHFRRYSPEFKTNYKPLTPPSSNEKLVFRNSALSTEAVTDKATLNSESKNVEPIVLKAQTASDSEEMENCVERGIKTKTLWVTSKYLLKDENTRYEKKNLGKKGKRRLSDDKLNDEVRLEKYNLWKNKKERPIKPPILVMKKEIPLNEGTVILNVDKPQMVLKDKTNSKEEGSVENPHALEKEENKFEKTTFKEKANVDVFNLKEESFRETEKSAAKENLNNDKRIVESPNKKRKLDQTKTTKNNFSPKKLNRPAFCFTFKIPKISKNLNSTEDLTKHEGKFTLNNRENKSKEPKKRRTSSDQLKTFQEEQSLSEKASPQNETIDSKIAFESKPLTITKDSANNLEGKNYQIEVKKRTNGSEKLENSRNERLQINNLDLKHNVSESKSKGLLEQKLPELPVLIENNHPMFKKVPQIENQLSKSSQNLDNYCTEAKKRKLHSEDSREKLKISRFKEQCEMNGILSKSEIKDPRKPPGSQKTISVDLKLPKFVVQIKNESSRNLPEKTLSSNFEKNMRSFRPKELNENLLPKKDIHPKSDEDSNKKIYSMNTETKLSLSNEFELIQKEIQNHQLKMKEIQDDQLKLKEIHDDQLKTKEIHDDQLKTKEIQDDQLKTKEIQDDQLKPKEIQDDQLKPKEIQDDQLKPKEIQDDQLKPKEIQDDQLKPKEIQDNQLKPKERQDDQLKPKEIQGDQLKPKEIQGDQLKPKEIQGDQLKPKEIQDDQLKMKEIQDDQLKLKEIHDDQLKPKEIHEDQLKPKEIHEDQLKPKEIHEDQLKLKEIHEDQLKLKEILDYQLKPKEIEDGQLKLKNNYDNKDCEKLLKGRGGKTKEYSELENSSNECKPKKSLGDEGSKKGEIVKKVSPLTHFKPKELNFEKIIPKEDFGLKHTHKSFEKTRYKSSLSKNDSKSKSASIPRVTKSDSKRSYSSKSTVDKYSKDRAKSNVRINKRNETTKAEKKLSSESKNYSAQNQRLNKSKYHSLQKNTDSKSKELEKKGEKTSGKSSPVPKENEREYKKGLASKSNDRNLKEFLKEKTTADLNETKKSREPFSKLNRRSKESDSFIKSKEGRVEKPLDKPQLYSRYDSRRESRPKYSKSYKSNSSVPRKSNYASSSIKEKRQDCSVKYGQEPGTVTNLKRFLNHDAVRNSGDNRRNSLDNLKIKSDSEKNAKQTTEFVKNLDTSLEDISNSAGLGEKKENPNSDEMEKLDLVFLDISNNASLVNKRETFITSKSIEENSTKKVLNNVNNSTSMSNSNVTKDNFIINDCEVNLPLSDPDLEDGEVLSDIDDFFTF